MHKIPREWVLFGNVNNVNDVNDYEEDLGDFPAENTEKPAESLVGASRAESTDQYTAGSGITIKIPPLFYGSTS